MSDQTIDDDKMQELAHLADKLAEKLFKTVGDYIAEIKTDERSSRAIVIAAFRGVIFAIEEGVDKTFRETLIQELNPATKPN